MDRDHIRIPIEIAFMVIDELFSTNELKTLFALSETCHALHTPSRRRVFSKIALGIHEEFLESGILSLTISSMDKLFSSAPAVATYIQKLIINITTSSGLDGDLLFPLLQKLCALTSLRLTSEMAWSVQLSENWNDMSPEMERCVHHLLQTPTLFELEIYRLQRIPILLLFAGIPQVRHLRLHASTIANRIPENPCPNRITSPLTLLDVRRKSINSLHRIISHHPDVDLSGLKELYISLEEKQDMVFLSKFLKTIRSLDLLSINTTCLTSEHTVADLMSAPSLAHIRVLHLEYPEGRWNRPEHLLKQTVDTLLALQHKHALQRLHIHIRCPTLTHKVNLAEGLESLDALLAGDAFCGLRRVVMCVEPAFYLGAGSGSGVGADSEGFVTTLTRDDLLVHLSRLNKHPDRHFTLGFNFKHVSPGG
ncbi:hypothetical protein JR316_0006903 [Psilocybe cubensis]|uniref:Uncharacterized protein n=2 Tax=Psilocybe cubensis TaxID=181762 RepID=A0ACB8GZB7_PSICU|nr:hypothetical protein JR316_0006903 [Psilocybe cubensis]KAH9480305.1 hypothetical protein JR316_0006903 [Psilocybe cubensis]